MIVLWCVEQIFVESFDPSFLAKISMLIDKIMLTSDPHCNLTKPASTSCFLASKMYWILSQNVT
jgi:hypothetical protein